MEGSQKSKYSVASLKETASALPRRKIFFWVAQWFTIPQFCTKLLSLCLSVVVVSLTLTWESAGVTIHDLDTSSFQFRGRVLVYVIVGLITVIYGLSMMTVGLAGVRVHAKILTGFSGLILLLWVFTAPIMSATVAELKDSKFARWRDVDVTILEVATGLGFVCKVVVIVDILLAFMQLTDLDTENAKFNVEIENSRSTIQAVKSGQSLPLSVSGSSTLRHRSSRTTTTSQPQVPPVAMETEEATLVAHDDPHIADEDSTWETI